MSTATAKNSPQPIRVLLDTNVIVSAIAFGGIPAEVLGFIIKGELIGITSDTLISEALEVFSKKIGLSHNRVEAFRQMMKHSFHIIHPKKRISILRDEPDNRVLEAAVEGHCRYIITGDKELLQLTSYKRITIIKPGQFLQLHINPF